MNHEILSGEHKDPYFMANLYNKYLKNWVVCFSPTANNQGFGPCSVAKTIACEKPKKNRWKVIPLPPKIL